MTALESAFAAIENIFSDEPIWIVGGAVRDRLLGRPTIDFDFVLLSDPAAKALQFAKKIGGSSFRLDDEFAITRVSHPDGFQFDFGRIQGKTLEEDIDRRDFTINALALPLNEWRRASWSKNIIDRHQGKIDLKKEVLTALHSNVFQKDPLRLLRAVRQAAELNFKIGSETKKQIQENAKRLMRSAPERIREEMLKLFSVGHSAPFVEELNQLGLLDILLPQTAALRKTGHSYYGKEGVLRHTLDSLALLENIFSTLNSWFPRCAKKIRTYLEDTISGHPRSAQLKWAILLHDLGKPETAQVRGGRLRFFEHEHIGAKKITSLAKRLRWSSDESKLYESMVRNHMRPGNLATHHEVSDKAIHRFFRDLGEDAVGMLLVSLGDHLSYLSIKERKQRSSAHEKVTIRMMNRYFLQREKILPPKLINGHEIMKALKINPSRLVGQLIKEIIEAQSEGKVKTKSQAVMFAKNRLPILEREFAKP